MSFFKKIFGDANSRHLKKIQPLIDKINQLESRFRDYSDDELKGLTSKYKARLKKGESLNDLLPEAFATVREAAFRTLKERPFNVQLSGAIILHQGKIAEMKTGEGKTLVATMPAYLNALTGKGVYIVTVNDYLAKRDAEWMSQVYEFLGLTVDSIYPGQDFEEKRKAYESDVTYGTNNEFGFDYLRDNMATALEQVVQRELHYAIVDEVDSILIDEARTPLIISAPDIESTKLYSKYSRIVPSLKENKDYNVDEKSRSVMLTDEGISNIEKTLGIDNIYEEGGIREVHHLEQALKAQILFHKDKDYVVKDGEIIIVDDFTGRLMVGRRYSEGLHQAIEAKEGVTIQKESRTLATITFQNYFRLFDKLSGMTGTALTSSEEFTKVYDLEVVVIETNKPVVREDKTDSIYSTEIGKFKAVAKHIQKCHKAGQPVLVGTISIEKSEKLSQFLKAEGVPHEVLNAKHHEREAEIVAKAGQSGAVTIATNMAGRGTDIKLGEGIPNVGGLCIIGTERHEARRIDNQLRGRSGRQGDPGQSQFFVSMEDDLMRIFGSDRMKSVMQSMGLPEDQAVENRMISRSIEKAQTKVEGRNFDIRKHVLEYDDVMNKQREVIYKLRRQILVDSSNPETIIKLKDVVKGYFEEETTNLVSIHSTEGAWNTKEIYETVYAIWNAGEEVKNKIDEIAKSEQAESQRREELIKFLIDEIAKAYEQREESIEGDGLRQIEKTVLLKTIDTLWMEHLDTMTYLRDSVGLQGYGQRDPLVEYKRKGYEFFQKLLATIRSEVVSTIFKVNIITKTESPMDNKNISTNNPKGEGATPKKIEKKDKAGRNDPCPCGSGKKYKKCCGQ